MKVNLPNRSTEMTDLTAAHEAAHEENAARTMTAWRNATGVEATDAAHRAWMDLPRFKFHAVIALWGGGKVHEVWSPSRKFLDQPYCGSSRWDGGRAQVTNAEVTCLKCLR
jgi:hypothetical protein